MDERIREVLPLVTKPIRYTGGEYNALLRDPDSARVSWVLAMPEAYELGMSNYGLRILYSIINRLDNAVCERCYAPWPDFGKALQERCLPLYALESKRPVSWFSSWASRFRASSPTPTSSICSISAASRCAGPNGTRLTRSSSQAGRAR